jgi:hypothetical protein
MNNARLMRYLWIPTFIMFAIGALILTNLTHSTAQSTTDCSPRNLNTRNWSTDFCNGDVDFEDFLSGGPPKDGIPSVANPDMESIAAAGEWLVDRSPVIAVEIDGEARAYPQAVLMWHEIANDEIAGVPIAVTFCPLCNSSITYDRRLDGEVLDFGVSGLLRNSDMVMFDRQTESWWQQLTGEGIVGEYADAVLEFVPSQVISFGQFSERYPDGVVMSRETGFGRNYGRNPYEGYDSGSMKPFLFRGEIDDRLWSGVAHVLAAEINDVPKAYPFDEIRETGVINDSIDETSIVIFYQSGVATALGESVIANGRDIGTAGMYESTVDGQLLTFTSNDDGIFTDEQTNSTWNAFGEAIDGELVGTELEWVNAFPHFWFAWAAFHPETEVYGL